MTVIVLLPLGLGPDQALLQRIAPGALWIALLLSVLLSAERIFQSDYEDGSLDAMALGVVPLELVVLAKAAAHWLTTALPLAIAAPLFGFLINLDPPAIPPLSIAMILGSLFLSLLAALGAAITVALQARRTPGLAADPAFLCAVPHFWRGGESGSNSDLIGRRSDPDGLVLAALVLVPVAAAAALRAYLK